MIWKVSKPLKCACTQRITEYMMLNSKISEMQIRKEIVYKSFLKKQGILDHGIISQETSRTAKCGNY